VCVVILIVYLLVVIKILKSLFICLNISKNLHHSLKNSTVLKQLVHIPTGFVGDHNHLQEIHLVSGNTVVKNCFYQLCCLQWKTRCSI